MHTFFLEDKIIWSRSRKLLQRFCSSQMQQCCYHQYKQTCISCEIPLAKPLKIITNFLYVFNQIPSFLIVFQKQIPLLRQETNYSEMCSSPVTGIQLLRRTHIFCLDLPPNRRYMHWTSCDWLILYLPENYDASMILATITITYQANSI